MTDSPFPLYPFESDPLRILSSSNARPASPQAEDEWSAAEPFSGPAGAVGPPDDGSTPTPGSRRLRRPMILPTLRQDQEGRRTARRAVVGVSPSGAAVLGEPPTTIVPMVPLPVPGRIESPRPRSLLRFPILPTPPSAG